MRSMSTLESVLPTFPSPLLVIKTTPEFLLQTNRVRTTSAATFLEYSDVIISYCSELQVKEEGLMKYKLFIYELPSAAVTIAEDQNFRMISKTGGSL